MTRQPRSPNDGWEAFLQEHNAARPEELEQSQGETRAERRAARKRVSCHICKEPLLGSGKPMLPSKRWRCDVEGPCMARKAQRSAQAL